MDRAGRIVLPKPIRDRLRLQSGDRLELKSFGNDVILHFHSGQTPLCKERGVWVYRSGQKSSVSIPDLISKIRNGTVGVIES